MYNLPTAQNPAYYQQPPPQQQYYRPTSAATPQAVGAGYYAAPSDRRNSNYIGSIPTFGQQRAGTNGAPASASYLSVTPSYNFYSNPALQQQLVANYQRPPTLREWFDSVDTNRSGTVDANELVMALRKGRINITPYGASKIIALFDTRGTRTIDFEQFKAMHPFLDAMTRGFKKRDATGDGYLQINEVHSALIDSGLRVSQGCLQTLMAKFDSQQRGRLSFDDYVLLSVFIAGVRNTFSDFDRQNVGQVEMDFNQFVTACIIVK